MKLSTIKGLDGSRIAIITLFGSNRPTTIVDWQKKVFDRFDIALNQIDCGQFGQSHGWFLDRVVEQTITQWDHLITFDMDAIPLRPDFLPLVHEKIRDGRTLFGGVQQSNHIVVNGTAQNVYVSPCFLAMSSDLYLKLGRPTFDHTPRGDCAEELTWRVKEQGFNLGLVYPSKIVDPCYPLDNGLHFGQGTTYGDLAYHNFCQDRANSEQMFVDKCKETLARYGAAELLSVSTP
jgi:hypothetical protein